MQVLYHHIMFYIWAWWSTAVFKTCVMKIKGNPFCVTVIWVWIMTSGITFLHHSDSYNHFWASATSVMEGFLTFSRVRPENLKLVQKNYNWRWCDSQSKWGWVKADTTYHWKKYIVQHVPPKFFIESILTHLFDTSFRSYVQNALFLYTHNISSNHANCRLIKTNCSAVGRKDLNQIK